MSPAKPRVGFAILTYFYLLAIICKLCEISKTHWNKTAQPTLRDGKFQQFISKRSKFSLNQGCIKKILLNPPLQKGEAFGMSRFIEMLLSARV
ncbi:MAG: hypothetical protein B1H12_00725 [Desulfobacteraceae bacterium 4484_190.2]|nr:MAG: hypothetical protein B1H12_00725 [Desulfobacteraceae bacterium 4484_190.2]